jgi:hypothetical protein
VTIIFSPYMANTPRLAAAWQRAGSAPRPAAAADAHPVLERAFANAEPPGARDRVTDAAEPAPPFAFRTPDEVLRRLPPAAAELLRRLDDAATEARDRTVSLSRHLDDARDRAGRVSLDANAAISAAKLPEAQTLDQARTLAALGKWPAHYTEPMRAHVARVVAEGQRLGEAEAEVARLRQKLAAHNERAAPITALRNRLAEAAARLRPPVKPLELPAIDPKRAEETLAEARDAIAETRAEIAAIETARPHPDDAEALAAEAVRRYATDAGGLRAAVRWDGGAITITEAVPGLATEDRRPLRPLAVLAAVMPDAVAAAIARTIGADPDAPRVADRPRLLAALRQRLREAEIAERSALAALGDPLDLFRPDADPLVALGVEPSR